MNQRDSAQHPLRKIKESVSVFKKQGNPHVIGRTILLFGVFHLPAHPEMKIQKVAAGFYEEMFSVTAGRFQ